jgi:CDP-diacylglycerol--glycerol-3-phosphate 3-phosphatidyltransferase
MIEKCKVGFMERPERIVLIIIGALFNRMAPVLWVLAVLSTITVIHRIRYTYEQTTLRERAEKAAERSRSAESLSATPQSEMSSR